ncbi:ac55 [Hemileuca sp. nucleopolyhedrovirus]|uniref:Ac55 n=1 Tax=Hemileuca sp. nucleopolyhedrovirus TaxID=1367203 RepID=S5N977_9ABAC|nr:ac55 [Hemileuca sp. nucleopolyhedrovirus]AGR56797.1 ac55 [Hemileuca sp. nucleopolyhedrovirus]
MSQEINFKLGKLIENTIDYKILKRKEKVSSVSTKNLASFYMKNKEDSNVVGRMTTYDVVGKRNYKEHFDETKYKF